MDSVITIDTAGRIVSFNPAAERMFGYPADEVLGQNVNVLLPTPFKEEHDDRIATYLKSGEKRIIGLAREVQGQRKNGTMFPAHLAVSEVRSWDHRLFTGIFRDISEQKRAEAAMFDYAEKLTAANEALHTACRCAETASAAKSEFLANMSHELRTPLHAILSFARFGIDEHATAPSQDLLDYFQMIDQSGQILLMLVNDLLDVSKLESGKETFDFRPCKLSELVSQVIDEFSSLCSERALTIHLEPPDADSEIVLDQEKAGRVVRNLLGNAVKLSPEGGTIRVVVGREEDRARVSVSDDGPGIPQEELETVFDKFVQSSKTKTGAGGTGLGLSICHQIITAPGGRIWAKNGPPRGAVFVFEIPFDLKPGTKMTGNLVAPPIGTDMPLDTVPATA